MTDITDTVPHIYSTETVEASCTESGYTLFTCDMCGDSFKANETPVLGHEYNKSK